MDREVLLNGPEVITPRRFGDVFLYNNSVFGSALEEDFFNPRRFVGEHSPDYSLRLVHDAQHPIRVGAPQLNGRSPTVRDVPIRMDSSLRAPRVNVTRRSPPPPPQRRDPSRGSRDPKPYRPSGSSAILRYFHVLPTPSGSSSSEEERKRNSNGYNNTNTLLTDRVQWRSCDNKRSNESPLVPPTTSPTRVSNTSTISLSPPSNSSERSSSLSEGSNRSSLLDTYDVPNSLKGQANSSDHSTTKPGLPPRAPSKTDSKPSTSVLLNVLEGLYDTPNPRPERSGSLSGKDDAKPKLENDMKRSQSMVSRANSEPRTPVTPIYDVPKSVKDSVSLTVKATVPSENHTPKEVKKELSQFGKMVEKEEIKVTNAVKQLQNATSKRMWRAPHVLQASLPDIQENVNDMCTSLGELVRLANSTRAEDAVKDELSQLLQPLRQSSTILSDLRWRLQKTGWTLASLSRQGGEAPVLDDLDRFLAVCRQVPDDCQQLLSLIRAHPELSFDQTQSVQLDPPAVLVDDSRVLEEHEVSSDLDDYDFVDSNNTTQQSGAVVNGAAPLSNGAELCAEDKQIVVFYLPQVDTHMGCLSGAIEDFFTSIEDQQTPKEFVAKSKLVILAAHKLVYIGDAVAQCLKAREEAEGLRKASDRLCVVLKESVTATKSAAEKYPAIQNVQAMVDSMVSVSHAAHELKLMVRRLSN